MVIMFTVHWQCHFQMKVAVPEHLKHRCIVQSITIIHEAEALLSSDHNLIDPELCGADIWIVGIVC